MKTLLVLRHAKSSWKQAELSDHERPLNKRGRRDAPRVAAFIHDSGLGPDLILSSTAVRARRKIGGRVQDHDAVKISRDDSVFPKQSVCSGCNERQAYVCVDKTYLCSQCLDQLYSIALTLERMW